VGCLQGGTRSIHSVHCFLIIIAVGMEKQEWEQEREKHKRWLEEHERKWKQEREEWEQKREERERKWKKEQEEYEQRKVLMDLQEERREKEHQKCMLQLKSANKQRGVCKIGSDACAFIFAHVCVRVPVCAWLLRHKGLKTVLLLHAVVYREVELWNSLTEKIARLFRPRTSPTYQQVAKQHDD